MNIFCERLKELRVERGLSLRELADLCCTSKSAISMYERGERNPKYETLEALADIFNVDIEYLVGTSSIRNLSAHSIGFQSLEEAHKSGLNLQLCAEKPSPDPIQLTEGEKNLLIFYRSLSDEGKRLFDETIDSLDGLSEEKQKLAHQMLRLILGNQ